MPHEFVGRDLDKKGVESLLSKIRFGHLGTVSREGKPYVVPVSYVYKDEVIYFHGSKKGRKVENIQGNPNVCFEVLTQNPLDACARGSGWECSIIDGTAEEVVSTSEKIKVYGDAGKHMHIYKIIPESISGRTSYQKK